eukprot:TRINITY_DN64892_c0_g2_i2.p1 TRINITY_DN64892_c0_g2~~TRINITY_DN64892_c0_g2_i2.p1  ORF type:complete len:642 (+),score=195.35 TRINITY_DN64892_c0_g2_i2:108-1928(+)
MHAAIVAIEARDAVEKALRRVMPKALSDMVDDLAEHCHKQVLQGAQAAVHEGVDAGTMHRKIATTNNRGHLQQVIQATASSSTIMRKPQQQQHCSEQALLLTLPPDTLRHVLEFLDVAHIFGSVALCCRALFDIVHSSQAWTSVRAFEMRHSPIRSAEDMAITFQHKWRRLEAFHCQRDVTDDVLAQLAHCKMLRSLGVSDAGAVTSSAFKRLTQAGIVSQLTRLELRNLAPSVQDAAFDSDVKHDPSLKELSIVSCRGLGQATLQALRIDRVQRLCLDECARIDNHTLRFIASVCSDSLRQLSIADCWQVDDTGVRWLRSCHRLEQLNVTRCSRITDQGLADVVQLPRLRSLNLSGLSMVTDGTLEIMSSAQLTELNLSGCTEVTDAGLAELSARQRSLRKLSLRDCRLVTHRGLSMLATSTLERLDLEGCSSLRSLDVSGLSNLVSLDVTRCYNLADGDLQLPQQLCCLRMQACPSLHASVAAQSPQLHHVDAVGSAAVDDKMLERVATRCTRLSSLRIGGSVTCDGIAKLVELRGYTLRSLAFVRCPLIDDRICTVLSGCTRLVSLSLVGCRRARLESRDRLPASLTRLTIDDCTLIGDKLAV